MIVIWRGLGALVILIPIVVCLIMNIATAKVFNETNYFQENLWPKVAALWLTGIVTVVIGLYVHSKPERILIDKASGQEVTRDQHTTLCSSR